VAGGVFTGIAGYLLVRHGLVWWMSRHGQRTGAGFQPGSRRAARAAGMAAASRLLAGRTGVVRGHGNAVAGWTPAPIWCLAAGRLGANSKSWWAKPSAVRASTVEETSLGGADGGIDLILRDGRRTLAMQTVETPAGWV
jgi:restriction system protein